MTTKQRVVRVCTERPTYAVCVLGTEISLDVSGCIPKGATHFGVQGTAGLRIALIYDPKFVTESTGALRWPLKSGVEVIVSMNRPSSAVNDNKVRVSYYGPTGEILANALLYLTFVAISLNADTNRNGVVQTNSTNKKKWTWGPNGKGAVLLVNCDRDGPSFGNMDSAYSHVRSQEDLQDMSLVILTTEGPAGVFENHKLLLQVSVSDASKLRVFHDGGNASLSSYKPVLGPDKLSYTVDVSGGGKQQRSFFVEGLAFPDAGFEGLLYLNATLLEASGQNSLDTPVFSDTVVFRVAPWIMTPNTMKPLEVFVCSFEKQSLPNKSFVEAVRTLAKEANCKLTVCPKEENWGDQWIQDEMEFGYMEAPHKLFPVVFDSPRNRDLDAYVKKFLGPDFGYVTREPKNQSDVSDLDSFGNLDVSPPVTVEGKEYPLGRILIGNSLPGALEGAGSRKMSQVVRDFLYAQKVQSPVELYSDWLSVGHVDEFLTFVPAPDRKGFRLLLASPFACYKLFKEKQSEGYGDVLLESSNKERKKTIDEILKNKTYYRDNTYAQKCIDWNRCILKRKLGLSEGDIIDIPQLFTLNWSRAEAAFPNMVNMLVLGKHLGIPKPFGPIIDGQCCLEAEVRSLLEPLGLTCTFINDFFFYHVDQGEVHCGTNVRREPFSFHWWNIVP
ncbi:PREDICTED: protein-arginine deiminase type-1-like [Gekko japonicus]|uniref:Protein-arginine deiminase n=1 Tax=Gekko japonicus TaxID=146911 RepID=A0ABM1K2W6_GEKJA|nr:PREDICTED: protein-arginine deiminase type-1-like [Gekko japonicus]